MKTIKDLDVRTKRVLMRCGLDMPLDDKGNITDDGRILASLESIKYVLDNGGTLTLMTHMGRPQKLMAKGMSKDEVTKKFTTKVIIKSIIPHLGLSEEDVFFCDDYYSGKYKLADLPDNKLILLENLRFTPGENSKDEDERKSFAVILKEFGDVFVNNDFGIPHRKNTSVYELAKIMDSYAGHLLLKEVTELNNLVENPETPFIAILGGAKVEGKVKMIERLKANPIIIIGAMKYAFDKARGRDVGASLCLGVDTAKALLDSPKKDSIYVVEQDVVVKKTESGFDYYTIRITNGNEPISENEAGLDIGEDALTEIKKRLENSKTVFWNGNAGLSEDEHFRATFKLVEILAGLKDKGVKVVVGGGDSVTALKEAGHTIQEFHHVSTGGGASLAVLSGEKLPALDVLGYY